ncbi:MAG: ATP-binding protein [Deltaproteobacteria bacterium]|nr:ATP-binding protein [Deltaproteobacteria bacterium]
MATSEQIKALLKSYSESDDSRFFAVAMQIAAHEARIGHGSLAKELRAIIDEAKSSRKSPLIQKGATPIFRPQGELSTLLSVSFPKTRLSDMVLNDPVAVRLIRIIKEQRKILEIRSHGLLPRRKLLLLGPPGTGKTMTASALAGELGLPLFVTRLDGVITKYMGETSAKLRLIFEALKKNRGVYLFDEFDSIGSTRVLTNDVGEMRRILNSFLQLTDEDESESLILSATNHPDILDHALYRRFDDILEYSLPDREARMMLIQNRLAIHQENLEFGDLADAAEELSHAELTRACDDVIKDMVINDRSTYANKDVLRMIGERQRIQEKS